MVLERARRAILILVILSTSAPSLAAQQLTTLMGGSARQYGFVFDLEASTNVIIDSFDLELILNFAPFDIEVWTTQDGGSYVGREENPHDWTRVSVQENVIPYGQGAWTPLQLDLNVSIAAGQKRGFYVARTDYLGMEGNFIGSPGAIYVQDGNLKFFSGFGTDYFKKRQPAVPNTRISYHVPGPFTSDLAVTRVLAPVLDPLFCSVGSTGETLQIEILNLGTAAIAPGTFIPVSYAVNGGPPVSEFALALNGIAPGATFSFTFTTPLDLSSIAAVNVTVAQALIGDLNPNNDSIEHVFRPGGGKRITAFPWEETFESLPHANLLVPPLGWTQETADSSGPYTDWHFEDNGFGTAPSVDHTTGIFWQGLFAYLNDQGDSAAIALRSPCLDLSGIMNPELVFWVYSVNNNSAPNSLFIDVLDLTNGQLTTAVHGPIQGLPAGWQKQQVDLSAFSGQLVRLVFRGNTDHGNPTSLAASHDIAIDDIVVYDVVPTNGQPMQPGLAEFRVGYTRNMNLVEIAPGIDGPFFSRVRPEELMLLEYAGQPNQPILLLGGLLNPAVAAYANIGSLDIGGPINPLTGIPSGIVILADGNLTDGVNPFFNTGPTGNAQFGVTLPNLPPGLLATFQCVMRTDGTNGSYIALSNAIKVIVE